MPEIIDKITNAARLYRQYDGSRPLYHMARIVRRGRDSLYSNVTPSSAARLHRWITSRKSFVIWNDTPTDGDYSRPYWSTLTANADEAGTRKGEGHTVHMANS